MTLHHLLSPLFTLCPLSGSGKSDALEQYLAYEFPKDPKAVEMNELKFTKVWGL